MIRGFIVNKFRGDPTLFADGLARIASATGWTSLGLVPFFPAAGRLPAEDALALAQPTQRGTNARVVIAVPILPHIANFDDLDPLAAEPAVDLLRVKPGSALPGDAGLVILPGSKATMSDLAVLRAAGFDIDIAAHMRRGGAILGLCGGYQMLGRTIADPAGVEGPPGTTKALEILDVDTVISGDKRLAPVTGKSSDGISFSGYEMHMGVTKGPDRARPFAHLSDGTAEGAVSLNGRAIGTYIHGLFADDRQRSAWLKNLGAGEAQIGYEAQVDDTLDALAAHLDTHLDLDAILNTAR
jgi:adenosylcobyric acid synthase